SPASHVRQRNASRARLRRGMQSLAVLDDQIGDGSLAADLSRRLCGPQTLSTPCDRTSLPERLDALPERDRFRNDASDRLTMFGDDDGAAGFDLANALAQRRFQLPDTDSFLTHALRPHYTKCGHIGRPAIPPG